MGAAEPSDGRKHTHALFGDISYVYRAGGGLRAAGEVCGLGSDPQKTLIFTRGQIVSPKKAPFWPNFFPPARVHAEELNWVHTCGTPT